MNFVLEGAHECSSGKGHLYEENVSLYWNLEEGTCSKSTGQSSSWLSLGDITILSNIAILIWKRFRYRMDLALIEISIYRDISRYIEIYCEIDCEID